MALTFQGAVEADCLVVTGDGAFDLDDAKQMFQHALDAASERGLRKVLVDCRSVTGTLTTTQRFELAVYVADAYRRRMNAGITRIAVVGHEPLIDPHRFGETVVVNRGVPGKVTTDINEAWAWLQVAADGNDIDRDGRARVRPAVEALPDVARD